MLPAGQPVRFQHRRGGLDEPAIIGEQAGESQARGPTTRGGIVYGLQPNLPITTMENFSLPNVIDNAFHYML